MFEPRKVVGAVGAAIVGSIVANSLGITSLVGHTLESGSPATRIVFGILLLLFPLTLLFKGTRENPVAVVALTLTAVIALGITWTVSEAVVLGDTIRLLVLLGFGCGAMLLILGFASQVE